MNNWIKVGDRLPEGDIFVDVWCGSTEREDYGHRYTQVLFINGAFSEDKLMCPSAEIITHWQPLPSPPDD